MIVELISLFAAVAVVIALFVLLSDPAEKENGNVTPDNEKNSLLRWTRFRQYRDAGEARKSPATSKAVILAMAQRGVYMLNENCKGSEEDAKWARKLMDNSCTKLDDFRPNLVELEQIISDFCDRLEEIIDKYQANLCEYNTELALVTEARISVEEEVYLTESCVDAKGKKKETPSKTKNGVVCRTKSWPATPERCPIDSTRTKREDYLMSVYGKFVNESASRLIGASK